MSRRKLDQTANPELRKSILKDVLLNGAAWEISTNEMIAAVSKKAGYKKKRLGAKEVKKLERSSDKSGLLTPEQATVYRGHAARENFLALDRPDTAFATKELCRDFSTPTNRSIEKLKRLVRYLVGKPRLLWTFPFQTPAARMDTYVDTDFAGCHRTRRSTSGGVILRGSHLLKH